MTREKKEILKKIEEIESFIGADMELGCGFAPADFYEPLEKECWELSERLAKLRHYKDATEMMMDPRGCENEGIPF